jgi:regulator of nucleoside diphosphate kinase
MAPHDAHEAKGGELMIARERKPTSAVTLSCHGTERPPLTSVPPSRPGTSTSPPQEGWRVVNRLRWILSEALAEEAGPSPHLADLADRLDEGLSQPLGRVPGSVVWMNSIVRVRNLDGDERSTFRLVFPEDADMARQRLSILAPVGAALFGRREGDRVRVLLPSRRVHYLEIDKVFRDAEAPRSLKPPQHTEWTP